MTTVIDRPAVLGGTPIRARDYPAWPVWDEHERDNLLAVLEAGGWWQGDGDAASTFAAELAHYQGARHGLALKPAAPSTHAYVTPGRWPKVPPVRPAHQRAIPAGSAASTTSSPT